MNEDIQAILMIIGVICGFAVLIMFSYTFGAKETLAQKCAETQGRYDFCVQKINWGVRQ